MIMTCILLLSGLPKAAVVNQNRLLTALVVLSSNGVTANDVIYVNLPLYHTAGFIIGFIGSIETGKMTWLLCCGMYGFNSKSHSVSDGGIFLPPKVKFCPINGKMVVVAFSLHLHCLVVNNAQWRFLAIVNMAAFRQDSLLHWCTALFK